MKNSKVKFAKLGLLSALALSSFSSHAILHSEGELPESEYKDYLVKLYIPNAVVGELECGGLLLGGRYIITADHCVAGNMGEVFGRTSDIRIVQSVDGSEEGVWATFDGYATSFSSRFFADVAEVVQYQYNDNKDLWLAEYNTVNDIGTSHFAHLSRAGFVDDNPWDEVLFLDSIAEKRAEDPDYSGWFGVDDMDLAIVKLNEVLPQTDSVKLGRTVVNGEPVIPEGTVMRFVGWGQNSEGILPKRAQTLDLALESSWTKPFAYEWLGDYKREHPDTELLVPVPCFNGAEVCYFAPTPADLYSTVGNETTVGDSGTPIVYENEVLGLVSSGAYIGENTKKTSFVNFNYTDNILDFAIGETVFPKLVNLDAEFAGEYSFFVQNLSHDLASVQVPMGYLSQGVEVMQGCEQDLAMMESCEVIISYEAVAENEVQSVTVDVDGGTPLQLTLMGSVGDEPIVDEPIVDEPIVDEPIVDEPDTDSPVIGEPDTDVPGGEGSDGNASAPSSGGSSGGSFGLLTLLGLGVLALRRRLR